MLGRSTLGRWAAAKTSTRDLPQLARFVHRTLLARNAADLPVARALSRAYTAALQSRRAYATTTAATKPTATVKRAVKAQAASKTAPKKKAAVASKTAKKPARKAAATKAKPKTRAKAKAKAKPKKKAAPKKRVKKVLTEEEQLKLKIKELRKVALRVPEGVTRFPQTALNAYVAENFKDGATGAAAERFQTITQAFKTLTPAEREHYNHIANEQTATKQAQYKAWIESHTPDQIRLANNARTQLRAKLKGTIKSGYPAHTTRLVDERLPKRPASAFSQFVKDRHATGDLKGIKVTDSMKVISEEWKALSAGEKKKYEDVHTAGAAEYSREIAKQGLKIPSATKA